jgi:hypothetical protein
MSWTDDLHADLVAAAGRRRRVHLRRAGVQLATAAGVLALGAGVAVAAITGHDPNNGGGVAATSPTTTTTGTTTAPAAPPAGGTFRVAVLNATTVSGLAGRVAQQLQAHGFHIGTVTNTPDRIFRTRIFATPDHLDEARVVADSALHLPLAMVGELKRQTDIGQAAPDAQIIVEAGRDLAHGVPKQITVGLTGVGTTAKATGTARLGGGAISITIAGLPKSNHYALWVGGRFMGFMPPAVGRSHVAHGVASLTEGHGEVLVTRETTSRHTKPGTVVARGQLP